MEDGVELGMEEPWNKSALRKWKHPGEESDHNPLIIKPKYLGRIGYHCLTIGMHQRLGKKAKYASVLAHAIRSKANSS